MFDIFLSPLTSRRSLILTFALVVALLTILPPTVYLQDKDEFEVNSLIKDVKKRFKLSARDVKSIRPWINRENRNVVAMYARFSGDRPEFSDRLWCGILAANREFEATVDRRLTARQKAALRAAHRQMQERIVNYLAEDYLSFLNDYLEFDEWTLRDVTKLFETAKAKKLELITAGKDVGVLQKQMDAIDGDTRRGLSKLLSDEQWRSLRDLTEPFVLLG